jgi:ABC-type Na+ efflux pump permease subunit
MRRLLALLVKDFWLHWRSVAMLCVGLVLAARALSWLLPPLERPGFQLPPITVPLALTFVMSCVTWLVDRERSRETFALLRVLPVSDLCIVGSKYLAYVLMQAFGLAVVLALAPVAAYLTPVQVVTTFMGLLAFASLTLTAQLSFAHRKAAAAPLVVLLLIAITALRLGHSGDAVRVVASRWHEPWFHASLWAASLALVAVCVVVAWLRIRGQDTSELIV